MPARPVWLVLLLLTAAPASAQMLPSGAWSGTLTGADGEAHRAQAVIERCATGFTLALTVDGRTATVPETAPATWRRGQLRFTTSRLRLPGTLVPRPLACRLEADDEGGLSGVCTSGVRRVRLRLAPPADGVLGCD